jgi:glycosyltransferase involved in cell wall biosynthesis
MKPIPLLILSDSVTSSSGLGRITRDLAQRIHEYMPDVFRVATIGYGGIGSRNIPWPDYHIQSMENWVVKELPAAWNDFAGDKKGIMLVIWDASRLLWLTNPEQYCPNIALREFLATKPFKLWTYSAIDATGPNDRLSSLLKVVLSGFDRVLAYSEWSARIIERTLGDGKTIDALPHGIDTAIWKPRGRDKARRKFGELILGPDVDFSIGTDQFLVGIVATNQARKDYGTAIEAVSMVTKERDTLVWIHTDALERYWSISALLHDYGLANRAIITTGRLSDEQMTWAYSACDVTLGIGLGEGFGFPIFESLACGTPCIHGDYAGAAEWLNPLLKIKPRAFRYDGAFASKRPVFDAQQWKLAMLDPRLKPENFDCGLTEGLDWTDLWQFFEAWFRKGIA